METRVQVKFKYVQISRVLIPDGLGAQSQSTRPNPGSHRQSNILRHSDTGGDHIRDTAKPVRADALNPGPPATPHTPFSRDQKIQRMIRDTNPPTFERLTWAELLHALLKEHGELRKTDDSRIVPCPFSVTEKICRVKKVATDEYEHEFYCVETLVVVKEDGRAVKADTSDYCPAAAATNAF